MSKKNPVRMSQARLERVQRMRISIADLKDEAATLANDAADPWRQTALADAAERLDAALRDIKAILDRDMTLPTRPSSGPAAFELHLSESRGSIRCYCDACRGNYSIDECGRG